MNTAQIYAALDPTKWFTQTNYFDTQFVSSLVTFDTEALTGCTYLSGAPIQNLGLHGGVAAPTTELQNFINNLRQEAAQRLADMHATAIVSQTEPSSVFGATG